jgi:hypothetical protein
MSVGVCCFPVHWLPLATCTPYPVETGRCVFIKCRKLLMVTVWRKVIGQVSGRHWQGISPSIPDCTVRNSPELLGQFGAVLRN